MLHLTIGLIIVKSHVGSASPGQQPLRLTPDASARASCLMPREAAHLLPPLPGPLVGMYQIAICINAYRYTSSSQTFVQTDIQYDIIQMIFRTGLLWTFIWI